jgi:hypothetical protein
MLANWAFVKGAALASTSPAVMCPLPSAVKEPTSAWKPLALNPRRLKAYCPLRTDSFPEPQPAFAVTVSVVEPLRGLFGGLLIIGVPRVAPVARPNGVIVTQVAVIVVLPGETLLASPAALIVATPGADEAQTTQAVRFWVLPLLK